MSETRKLHRINFLDRVLGYFSPERGARRLKARIQTDVMARGYDAASTGRRTKGWTSPGSRSANEEIGPALNLLRARSRDLVRNHGYSENAINVISSQTVGTGAVPRPMSGEPTTAGKALEKKTLDLFKQWSKECDTDGVVNFSGMQALIMRALARDGEVLVRRRRRLSSDGLSVPIQLQVLEADFLDTSKVKLSQGSTGRILQGIEFDALGRRTAYHLFRSHPGESGFMRGTSLSSVPVPASEILHIFRADRPGQVRGVPWGASIITRSKDFDDHHDARLMQQKIAACFAGFERDLETPGTLTQSEEDELSHIEPGVIQRLGPGKSIEFATPPKVDGFSEFSSEILHEIAAGWGISYESMTGDYSQVNYSSGRMGWLKEWANIKQWRTEIILPRFLVPVWEWFVEAATLSGALPGPLSSSWTFPRREMIDPTKEVGAQRDAIRSGLASLPEAQRQNGQDPDEVFAEIATTNEKLDELGIILDSDPRRTTKSGGPVSAVEPSDSTADEDDDSRESPDGETREPGPLYFKDDEDGSLWELENGTMSKIKG